jgi:DNA-binding NarL/FixJ family response regulator
MGFSVAQLYTGREWSELTSRLGMSARQVQIAQHLLEGLEDKQIAAQLGISVHTVRTYLDRMFAKLSVQDRNGLVVSMFRQFRAGCGDAKCPRCH